MWRLDGWCLLSGVIEVTEGIRGRDTGEVGGVCSEREIVYHGGHREGPLSSSKREGHCRRPFEPG